MEVIFFGAVDGITDEPLFYNIRGKRWQYREKVTPQPFYEAEVPEGAKMAEIVGGPHDGEVLDIAEFLDIQNS